MKQLTKERNDCENAVIAQKEISDRIGDQIIVNAFDLKREYQALNPKPALALSIDKQIFLNDQIYHEDVFPISQIRLTKPTGDMAELSNIWIAATTIEMPPTRQSANGQMQPEIEQPVQETEVNEGQDNRNNTRQNNNSEQETQYAGMGNDNGNSFSNEEGSGEFGEVFNENEIIV